VSAARRDGSLALIVSDDGPGLHPARLEQPGIGLANTRSRLKRLYGDGAGLVAENADPHGARVTIMLPLRTTREDAACG
jgi:LytS/YehU family sensor histidine kinase